MDVIPKTIRILQKGTASKYGKLGLIEEGEAHITNPHLGNELGAQ